MAGSDRQQKAEPKPVEIDFQGIGDRIVAIGEPAGNYSTLQPGPAGKMFYLDWTNSPHEAKPEAPNSADPETVRPRKAQERDGPVGRRRLSPYS